MLEKYEELFNTQKTIKKKLPKSAITNLDWVKNFQILNTKLAKSKQPPADPKSYMRVKVLKAENSTSLFKPSQLIQLGEYPMANLQTNSFTLTMFGNYKFFSSNDHKLIN